MSETPTLIYLEADDEVTTVVRRLRQVEGERVVLVAPGRSRATSSVVALRLLARLGEEAGVTIAVAGDALTRSLAAEAGLDTYASVEDARNARPAAPADAPTRQASIHVVRGEAASDETAPVPLSAVVAPATAADREATHTAVSWAADPPRSAAVAASVPLAAIGALAMLVVGVASWELSAFSAATDSRHAAQRSTAPSTTKSLCRRRTRRRQRGRPPVPAQAPSIRAAAVGPSCFFTSTPSMSLERAVRGGGDQRSVPSEAVSCRPSTDGPKVDPGRQRRSGRGRRHWRGATCPLRHRHCRRRRARRCCAAFPNTPTSRRDSRATAPLIDTTAPNHRRRRHHGRSPRRRPTALARRSLEWRRALQCGRSANPREGVDVVGTRDQAEAQIPDLAYTTIARRADVARARSRLASESGSFGARALPDRRGPIF